MANRPFACVPMAPAYVIARRWRPAATGRANEKVAVWASASTSIAAAATPLEAADAGSSRTDEKARPTALRVMLRVGAATSIVTVARPSKVSVAACGTRATS